MTQQALRHQVLVDAHTHTVASGHAFSTLQEMAQAAAEKGFQVLDFERLVKASKETHTLLEINNHSLAPERKKTVARGNNLELLRLCKQYEVPTILGSDAHISYQIADYGNLLPLLAATDFPDDLIMNFWPDRFFNYLGI